MLIYFVKIYFERCRLICLNSLALPTLTILLWLIQIDLALAAHIIYIRFALVLIVGLASQIVILLL